MTKEQVLSLLEANKNPRGIAHFEKLGFKGVTTYGYGMGQLKKIAKQVGRNHELALELWELPVYDAKILATLVDEPKKVSEAQADKQVLEAGQWMISHAFCSYLMAKTPFVKEKAEAWAASDNPVLRSSGYALFYHIAKDNKKLTDDYFEPYLDIIEANIRSEENFVKDGMNNALLMIGQRSKTLNERALAIAKKIGKVEVDYGDNSCEAPDCVKHLSSPRIQAKFA